MDRLGGILQTANVATGKKKVVTKKRFQMGSLSVQGNCHRLRYWTDSENGRKQQSVNLGKIGTLTAAELKRKQLEIVSQINSPAHLKDITLGSDTFRAQSVRYLANLKAKPATRAAATSTLEYHILPVIGELPLSEICSGAVKRMIDAAAGKGLSMSLMNQIIKFTSLVKMSAVDPKTLDPLYPDRFNLKAIFKDVDKESHNKVNRPCPQPEQVSAMVESASGWFRVFLIVAAASGLRFGELLGLEIPHIVGNSIHVRQSVWRGEVQSPKTRNAVRVVDLHPDIVKSIRDYVGDRKEGFIFPVRHQGGITEKLYKVQDACGVTRAGMHSLRRFRNTHLTNYTNTPRGLILAWMGWSKTSMQDNYDKIENNISLRQLAAESAGYGFDIPKGSLSVTTVTTPVTQVTEDQLFAAA